VVPSMSPYRYVHGRLYGESVPLTDVARYADTPCYVYSRNAIEARWRVFDSAFGSHPHRVCYAVKANSNLAVLNLLARLGSGFDVVSVGELERVLQAGGDPALVAFSGVGKRASELRRALAVGIACFNVESVAELELLDQVAAALGRRAPVALRVNPDVDAGTHPYIATGLRQSKFGIPIEEAPQVYARAAGLRHLEVTGIACHIGSQLTDVAPFVAALARVLTLAAKLEAAGLEVRHVDMGGGLGIRYRDELPPTPAAYAEGLIAALGGRPYTLWVEPGRAIVGEAGVLLTRVEYLKPTLHRNFAVVDAAMNDLLRPALYGAWHEILEVEPEPATDPRVYDVVGPVCETGDFLGKDRSLRLRAGSLIAVCSVGAYGFVMGSNYNTRPRPAEIMLDGARFHVVRRRETLESLWAGEELLP
jgi:diaminopimelate decarboxylase